MRILISAVSCLLLALSACSKQEETSKPTTAAQTADYVFTGGKVYTVDNANSWAQAVAVRGNQIVYVGDDAGAKAFVGDNTKKIDLGGKMMLPGFVEGHFHTLGPALLLRGPDLQTDSLDEMLAKFKTYVDKNPDLKLVHGWGVRPNIYGPGQPTAAMLDKIVPDRPVFLWEVGGHSAWVNSKAMAMAGLTKDTPDPVPGVAYYRRDAGGNPTGYIVEVPAIIKVLSKFVTFDEPYVREGMASWFPKYPKAGITTVHDFGFAGADQDTVLKILKDFEKDGTLGIRVFGSYYWNNAEIDPVPLAKKLRDENREGLVRITALKINMDGDDDNRSMLLVDPYADKRDAKPEPIIPFDKINDAAVRADKEKLHLLCHCFGDLAVRKFLDAVELAKKTNPEWDRRAVASHALLVNPDDYPRFKALNATYDTSGQWMALDPYFGGITPKRIGAERMKRLFPVKPILDAGGNVSLGSDFPAAAYVSDYKPLNAITVAVTRQMLDKPDMPVLGGKDMRLTVAQAIRANTYAAAYGTAVEDKVGSIEVGKLADLIVLEKNLFDIDPHDIHKVKVQMTMMDGVIRHQDGM